MDIPSDLFFLFIIRMDDQMLSSVLDEEDTYMDLSAADFAALMKQKIEFHKSLGDTTLLALPGTFDRATKSAYSFMGNKSKESFGIVIEVNDKKELLSISEAKDFVFDEFPFNIDSF